MSIMCKRLDKNFELREYKGNQETIFWEVWFKRSNDIVKLKGILIKELLIDKYYNSLDGYEVILLEKGRGIGIYEITGSDILIKFLNEVSKSELGRNVGDWFDLMFSIGYISSSNMLEMWIEYWGVTELQNDLKWLCEKNSDIRKGFENHHIFKNFLPIN
jgi:hypothetical protein